MLEDFTGDILGLVLSYCPVSDFKSIALYSRSCYETHFSDPNSTAFTEWLLQIIAKSSEKPKIGSTIMTRELWHEIDVFKPYVLKQLSRRKLIPKETTCDQISALNCLQVISFMNNNWLEMKNLFYSSDFYTFQANSRCRNMNGILCTDLESINVGTLMLQNGGITIEAWINVPQNWQVYGQKEYLVYLRNKDTKVGIGLISNLRETLDFEVGSETIKSHIVKPFEWTHIAGVYDKESSQATFYVNGEIVGMKSQYYDASDFETNMELVIASSHDDGCIPGEYTDIRIWNTPRTQKQIKASMGRRIFVYHFENTLDMNYLVFNCYPDPKMDVGNLILNKSPNFRYRTNAFHLHSNIDFLGGPIQSRLFHQSVPTAKFKI